MKFRGGEFSTGTTGNFQPELTGPSQRHVALLRRFPLRRTGPIYVQRNHN